VSNGSILLITTPNSLASKVAQCHVVERGLGQRKTKSLDVADNHFVIQAHFLTYSLFMTLGTDETIKIKRKVRTLLMRLE